GGRGGWEGPGGGGSGVWVFEFPPAAPAPPSVVTARLPRLLAEPPLGAPNKTLSGLPDVPLLTASALMLMLPAVVVVEVAFWAVAVPTVSAFAALRPTLPAPVTVRLMLPLVIVSAPPWLITPVSNALPVVRTPAPEMPVPAVSAMLPDLGV